MVLAALLAISVVAGVTATAAFHAWRRRGAPPNRAALTAAVVSAAAVVLLLWLLVRDDAVVRIDVRIAEWASDRASAWTTDVLAALTWLGGTSGVFALTVFVVIVESVRLPSRVMPLYLVAVVVGQSALNHAGKAIVERARPDIDPLAIATGTAFPSGHSTAAAACFAAFAVVIARRRDLPVRAALFGTAVGCAVAVAGTRVLLGVHWVTDVVAGLALGWGWFALVTAIFGERLTVGTGREPAGRPADPG